jgi:hypothetical protein
MATPKRRKLPARKSLNESTPIMVAPKQTATEIARRVAIREAMHDLRAKTVRGKSG